MTAAWGGREPRAWQADALPLVLGAIESRVPSIVRAVTGSGKSVLIAEVIASRLPHLRAGEVILVSTPTQALTAQLVDTIGVRVGRDLVGAYYQHARRVDTPVIVVCHASLYGEVDLVCPLCATVPAVGVRWLAGDEARDVRASWAALAAGGKIVSGCRDLGAHGGERVASLASRLTLEIERAGLTVALHIADECHKTVSPSVGAHFAHAHPSALIGFTATPYRATEGERLALFDRVVYDYGLTEAIRDGVILLPTLVSGSQDLVTDDEIDAACTQMICAHLERHGGAGVVSAQSIEDAEGYAAHLAREGVRAEAIHSRQGRDVQASLLERLRVGALDALVHVSLLAEGVDLPWLSWLCMRRQTSSRVRFAQEVGRVVRTAPGKTGCWVLDPHDLWGQLSLDYDAVLGCSASSPEDEIAALAAEVRKLLAVPAGESLGGGAEPKRAAVMGRAQAWLRRCAVTLRLMGADGLRASGAGAWRREPATTPQLDYARRLMQTIGRRPALVARLDEATRALLWAMCKWAPSMSKGDVADLITVLKSLEGGVLPPVEVV
jgi:superfamily II DNA or RNA helicase